MLYSNKFFELHTSVKRAKMDDMPTLSEIEL